MSFMGYAMILLWSIYAETKKHITLKNQIYHNLHTLYAYHRKINNLNNTIQTNIIKKGEKKLRK